MLLHRSYRRSRFESQDWRPKNRRSGEYTVDRRATYGNIEPQTCVGGIVTLKLEGNGCPSITGDGDTASSFEQVGRTVVDRATPTPIFPTGRKGAIGVDGEVSLRCHEGRNEGEKEDK